MLCSWLLGGVILLRLWYTYKKTCFPESKRLGNSFRLQKEYKPKIDSPSIHQSVIGAIGKYTIE